MKAEDFDRKFDNGEDITEYLDLSKAKRHRQQSISIILPDWMIQQLQKQAQQENLSTDIVIENYLAQHLT